MAPLFVSYVANWKGDHRGWVVLDSIPPIVHGRELEEIVQRIEKIRGWPLGTVSIVSFHRLETVAAVSGVKEP